MIPRRELRQPKIDTASCVTCVVAGSVADTPFYDLICTQMYPGLSPEFAFAIGGEVRPAKMTAENLAQMARQMGMQPRFLAQQAADMATWVPDAVVVAVSEVTPALTSSVQALAERLVRFVSSNIRKLAARLAA